MPAEATNGLYQARDEDHQGNGCDEPYWPASWLGRRRGHVKLCPLRHRRRGEWRNVESGTPDAWPHCIITQQEAEEQRQEIKKAVVSGRSNEQLERYEAATGYKPQAARRQDQPGDNEFNAKHHQG